MTKRNKYHPGGGAVRQCTRLTSSLEGAEISEERAREINTLLQPPSTYSECFPLAKGRRGYRKVNANECNSFRDGSFSNSLIKRTVEVVHPESSSSPAESQPKPSASSPAAAATSSAPALPPASSPSRVRNPIS